MPRTSPTSGFTIIEVLIVAPIVIITITGFVALLVVLLGNNLASRGELTATYDVNAAFSGMEDDIRITAAFLATQDDDFQDPYGMGTLAGANHEWNFEGTATENVLLTRTYATDRSIRSSEKEAVYVDDGSCVTAESVRNCPPLTLNLIYFVRDGTLYRRVLMDERYLNDTIDTYIQGSSGPEQAEPFQRQSCPPDRGDNDSVCGANDELLVHGIEEFAVEYFTSAGVITTSPTEAESVKINIALERRVAGEQISLERSLRAHKLN